MRNRKLVFRLIGILTAITGAVIIIHTVPVFVWYLILIVLVLSLAFVMLNS